MLLAEIRRTPEVITTAARPNAIAGTGPSSPIARTIATSEPLRWPAGVSMLSQSPTSASASEHEHQRQRAPFLGARDERGRCDRGSEQRELDRPEQTLLDRTG